MTRAKLHPVRTSVCAPVKDVFAARARSRRARASLPRPPAFLFSRWAGSRNRTPRTASAPGPTGSPELRCSSALRIDAGVKRVVEIRKPVAEPGRRGCFGKRSAGLPRIRSPFRRTRLSTPSQGRENRRAVQRAAERLRECRVPRRLRRDPVHRSANMFVHQSEHEHLDQVVNMDPRHPLLPRPSFPPTPNRNGGSICSSAPPSGPSTIPIRIIAVRTPDCSAAPASRSHCTHTSGRKPSPGRRTLRQDLLAAISVVAHRRRGNERRRLSRCRPDCFHQLSRRLHPAVEDAPLHVVIPPLSHRFPGQVDDSSAPSTAARCHPTCMSPGRCPRKRRGVRGRPPEGARRDAFR